MAGQGSLVSAPSGPNEGGIGAGQRPMGGDEKVTFQDEKSLSELQAGRILMEMKIKGVPEEKGDAQEKYQKSVQQVKQGVNEAILREQVPPGYHDTVKTYFEQMGNSGKDAAPATPAPPAQDTK